MIIQARIVVEQHGLAIDIVERVHGVAQHGVALGADSGAFGHIAFAVRRSVIRRHVVEELLFSAPEHIDAAVYGNAVKPALELHIVHRIELFLMLQRAKKNLLRYIKGGIAVLRHIICGPEHKTRILRIQRIEIHCSKLLFT